ncbi:reverse transcriptase domain-containing protein [Tanacetum coccineum]
MFEVRERSRIPRVFCYGHSLCRYATTLRRMTIPRCLSISPRLSHPSQHYGVTCTLDYAVTSFKPARWKVRVNSLLRKPPKDLRGDQGLHSLKNSTRSPREITLNLLLYLIVHKQLLLWFRWISFDYRVTLGFGSIAGGLDHVNPVIRLPLERGISRAPGVVKPEIKGNVNFEIKSQFMRELREDTFSGNKNKDAHDHVDRVLNIVSLFNIPGVSQDAVLLRVFPFTLTESAKRWVDRLTPGTVNTWDLLKKAFIQRYCPPSKTAKRLEDIHNFK